MSYSCIMSERAVVRGHTKVNDIDKVPTHCVILEVLHLHVPAMYTVLLNGNVNYTIVATCTPV